VGGSQAIEGRFLFLIVSFIPSPKKEKPENREGGKLLISTTYRIFVDEDLLLIFASDKIIFILYRKTINI
jgi:hypothetical protein